MDRRSFVAGLAALGAPAGAPPAALAQPHGLLPSPEPAAPAADQLQSGDFLWPKPPGAIVPYAPALEASGAGRAAPPADAEKALWEAQRTEFLRQAPRTSPAEIAAARRIEALDYAAFQELYNGAPAGAFAPGPAFYVGHVAIVDLSESSPMVIEAVPDAVIRKPYAEWAAGHARDQVFHGRCRAGDAQGRARIADEARRHLGVKYDFFNFDLGNAGGFYCSKLAWLATKNALGVALDGDANPRRWIWFSPKQMFYCETIQHLNSDGRPGDYAPV